MDYTDTKQAIDDFRARMLAAVEALAQDLTPKTTAAVVRKNHPAQVVSTRAESKGELVCESVSAHALDRWSKQGDVALVNRLAKFLAVAEEHKLLPEYEAREIMNHGYPSRFWKHGGFIFAVESRCVVTVHTGQANRWEPKHKNQSA